MRAWHALVPQSSALTVGGSCTRRRLVGSSAFTTVPPIPVTHGDRSSIPARTSRSCGHRSPNARTAQRRSATTTDLQHRPHNQTNRPLSQLVGILPRCWHDPTLPWRQSAHGTGSVQCVHLYQARLKASETLTLTRARGTADGTSSADVTIYFPKPGVVVRTGLA